MSKRYHDYTSNDIGRLINFSYKLGMSQDRDEILSFAKFLNSVRPHNVLEIGTKLGGNFYLLSKICTGLSISIDLPGGIHGGWILNEHPYLGDVYELRNQFFSKLNSNIFVVTGNSHYESTRSFVSKILREDKIGLLFIDGDHTYEGVKRDYEMYKDFVHKEGYIVFHDINNTEHHRRTNCGVWKLWEELEGEKIEFNNHLHWAGIGVLKK